MTDTSGDLPSTSSDDDVRRQISGEILQIHVDSYGAGASRVDVHLLSDLVLVLIDGLELTAGEKTLMDGGYSATVKRMRSDFQAQIGSTFTAAVERATGRRVSSFMSNTDLGSLFSVEFFRLAPAG